MRSRGSTAPADDIARAPFGAPPVQPRGGSPRAADRLRTSSTQPLRSRGLTAPGETAAAPLRSRGLTAPGDHAARPRSSRALTAPGEPTAQPLRSRGLSAPGDDPGPWGLPPARPGGSLVATAEDDTPPRSGHRGAARASAPPARHRHRQERSKTSRYAGPLAMLVVGGTVAAAILGFGGTTESRKIQAESLAAPVDNPIVVAGPNMTEVHDLVLSVEAAAKAPRVVASRSKHRAPLHEWIRPAAGVLTSGFGMRWGHLHAGIDLAGPYGAPIRAATDGCISYAGPESGYGEVMKINDWDGTQTVYGHMEAFVRTSGCVKAGQLIARIGAAGDATGPHLHFEVRIGGVPIDPIPFLERRDVRV